MESSHALTSWLGASAAAALIAGAGAFAPFASVRVSELPEDSRSLVTGLLTAEVESKARSLAGSIVEDYVAAFDRTFVSVVGPETSAEGVEVALMRINGPALELETVFEAAEDGIRMVGTRFRDVTLE